MATSFTYTNFPHLWDTIIYQTSHDAQLQLRLVSRSLCHAIDSLMARHLVLSAESFEDVLATGPDRHIPYFTDEFDALKIWSRPRTIAMTEGTRVVDIQGYFPPSTTPPALERMNFPRLQMLRMTTSLPGDESGAFTPYVPFPAKTLVLFANRAGMESVEKHWYITPPGIRRDPAEDEDDDDKPPMMPDGVDREKIPDSYEKVVINLKGRDSTIEEMFPFTASIPAHVKEVVIVAPWYEDGYDEGTLRDMSSMFLTRDLMHFIGPGRRNTLVGFETLDMLGGTFEDTFKASVAEGVYTNVDYSIDDALTRAMFPATRRLRAEQAERARQSAAEDAAYEEEGMERRENPAAPGASAPRPLMSLKEKVDSIMSSVQFVDLLTYAVRVGMETAELEVAEDVHREDINLRRFGEGLDWRRNVFVETGEGEESDEIYDSDEFY